MLTQAKLKKLLHYDTETGVFTWLSFRSRLAKVGYVAGTFNTNGYLRIQIDGKQYKSHRLAWFYVHGYFPTNDIDHINRVRTDNRLCNLRLANRAENMQNTSMRSNNTSGHVRVSWDKNREKWLAGIRVNKKTINLGYFTDINDAIASRKAGEQKYHTFNQQVTA